MSRLATTILFNLLEDGLYIIKPFGQPFCYFGKSKNLGCFFLQCLFNTKNAQYANVADSYFCIYYKTINNHQINYLMYHRLNINY